MTLIQNRIIAHQQWVLCTLDESQIPSAFFCVLNLFIVKMSFHAALLSAESCVKPREAQLSSLNRTLKLIHPVMKALARGETIRVCILLMISACLNLAVDHSSPSYNCQTAARIEKDFYFVLELMQSGIVIIHNLDIQMKQSHHSHCVDLDQVLATDSKRKKA